MPSDMKRCARLVICKTEEPLISARFWQKVQRQSRVGGEERCWNWIGSDDGKAGYGNFTIGASTYKAHRVSYALAHGETPAGFVVMHSCDNRKCVNPAHLSLGSDRANDLDAREKGRKSAPKGEDNGISKLSDQAIREIRAAQTLGIRGMDAYLARRYGVTQTLVYRVKRREIWNHVEDGAVDTAALIEAFKLDHRHPGSKLSPAAVLEIRALYDSNASRVEIAKRYDITKAMVWQIGSRKSWSELPESEPKMESVESEVTQ